MTEAELLRDDFRTIAEAMPQLVWTASGDGKIDYFNQRWIDYTGVDLDEYPYSRDRRGERLGRRGAVHAHAQFRPLAESGEPCGPVP